MILITGADGFIGKKLTVLVRKKYRNEKIVVTYKNKLDLVKDDLSSLPTKPRLIFHLAAATDTSKPDQRCNNIGTKNLIDHLEIGPKTHFIFTSSQAIFSGRTNTGKPIDKNTKPNSNNAYGKTKLEAEKILASAARKKKFKLTIIRLPTVWGDNPRKNSFLNFLKSLVASGSPISRLNFPGKIGLIYVDDAVKFILDSAQKPPKIVSICAQNLTLSQIFQKLAETKGKKYKQIGIPEFMWALAVRLKPYLKYLEPLIPSQIYNYFWRALIVIDSPLWCKVNLDTGVTKM